MNTGIKLETRNASLSDLADLLKDQQAAKVDLVVPMSKLTSRDGVIAVDGSGVFTDQRFAPTAIADGHLAEKLGVPVTYLRKMRAGRVDLYDANVNGWAKGSIHEGIAAGGKADARSVLLRTFQSGDPSEVGVLRAVLSDKYGIIDNFDVLVAALEGARDAGTEVEVVGCDLTETRMTVRIAAPEIFTNAPELLKGYRNPFGGDGVYDHSNGQRRFLPTIPQWAKDKFGADDNGVVFAGLVLANCETGGGAFTIVPRFTVLSCLNGMMMTQDALRQIHLGGQLESGVVKWSGDTQQKALKLVTAQARDAVASFLDRDYIDASLARLAEKAGVAVTNPVKAIEVVAKTLSFTNEQRDGILDHFIRGGQVTAGGVMQAVTSFAQTVESADAAYDLEATAVRALEIAAAL